MLKLYTRYQVWRADDEGATAVEYGIMVAAIAAVIIAVVFAIGLKVETAFNTVNNQAGF